MRKFLTWAVALLVLAVVTPASADVIEGGDAMAQARRRAAPPAAPSWQGLYIGGNVGYSWGPWDNSGSIAALTGTTKPSVDGLIGGVQAGFNWQFNRQWILGIEGDYNWTDEKNSSRFVIPNFIGDGRALTIDQTWKLNWLATIRGRIGYLFAPDWMAYFTGGYAVGHVDYNAALTLGNVGQASFSEGKTKSGWTIGGGAERMVNRNWSAKLEYLYVDLGSDTSTLSGLTTKYVDHIIRFGVNYKFN